jgi:CRP/FNR family transcriptional regulator
MSEAARALARVAPDWPEALRAAVLAESRPLRAPDGAQLFGPGDACRSFLVPLSGAVRVEHTGASGRSVVLYRVAPGESCVMTTSCLLAGRPYEAYGHAEGEVEALGMPAAAFRRLLETSPAFREMALAVFSARVIDLVEVIDELLLRRVDLRLALWLAGRAPSVRATHQSIAAELGTAREVVSRVLKEFERRGWIALGRGEVTVADADALQRFGKSEGT